MRVLHTVAPAWFGGLEEVVIRLAGGLMDRGHDVTVAPVFAGEPQDHPFLEGLRRRGVKAEPHCIPSRSYLREIRTIRALVEDRRVDVVHTHGYRPGVLHPRAARPSGTPVVTTLHGFTGGDWKNRIYERLQVRSAHSMDAVIAVSRALAEGLRARGLPEHLVHVVPNAWEPRKTLESADRARAALGVPPERFHVGWVGRLSREKGPDVLLEALARMPASDTVVSIVGDGHLREKLEARAGEIGGLDIRFHGVVPDAVRLFSGFDTLVLSSRTEGTPIVLFEAMAASIPVIATSVGGIPDVIGDDTGLLVPSEDPSALADAIETVRRSRDQAAERANRALRKLDDRFSVEPWLERHEAIYAAVRRESSKTRLQQIG